MRKGPTEDGPYGPAGLLQTNAEVYTHRGSTHGHIRPGHNTSKTHVLNATAGGGNERHARRRKTTQTGVQRGVTRVIGGPSSLQSRTRIFCRNREL